MQQHFFSDRDIEEYLDGIFEGDIEALKGYLEHNPEGRARLASVRALYAALQEEQQPQLSFSLSRAVINTLEARESKKGFRWNGILWIVGWIAGLMLLFYCFRLLSEFQLPDNTRLFGNLVPFAIFMALIIVAFHWTDVHRMKKRYDISNTVS
jgi:hypothetical protein